MTKVKRGMWKTVRKIEAFRPEMRQFSDAEIRAKTQEYRVRIEKGEKPEHLLPEAFALVREASFRTLGMEHFPVQLLGGMILHYGNIAEMKTGEGKTLVSTLPAYLNALCGKGVHIVTVNDYLAKRDADMMGKVFQMLGMRTGVVLSDTNHSERKSAYQCDITYVTNSEIGFDYLRDNLVTKMEDRVLRGLYYAVVDEIDSILIDEARTPLIISGQGTRADRLYEGCDILAKGMVRSSSPGEFSQMDVFAGLPVEEDGDFIVNEKDHFICLTCEGVRKAEAFFHIENLSAPDQAEKQHTLLMALQANYLQKRNKDYVVKNGEVLIVDEFTGRILPGRRYSDGLHQALEAKEHVKIKRESRTHAAITFQHFFNKYTKLSGMTGTAMTEAKEFKQTYGLDVYELPTNKPVIRKDLEDQVYRTKREKYHAVVETVRKAHAKGQPVLIGTPDIEDSEELSRILQKNGISHQVLNAKQDEMEARIIAEAGKSGVVTIATNMAGRGTDIQLDREARLAGGLKVIGTQRHESRRIDNQLRGRSGRQGDPGDSCFFVSLEDELFRLFGSEKMVSVFRKMNIEENEPIDHRILTGSIRKAQKRVEENNYRIRKNLLSLEEVMNEQRECIYRERDRVLSGIGIEESLRKIMRQIIDDSLRKHKNEQERIEHITMYLPVARYYFHLAGNLRKNLYQAVEDLYQQKEKELGSTDAMRSIAQVQLLRIMDRHWMDQIHRLELLKEGISLQSYAQRDPIIIYKEETYLAFDEMIDCTRKEWIRVLFQYHYVNGARFKI